MVVQLVVVEQLVMVEQLVVVVVQFQLELEEHLVVYRSFIYFILNIVLI